MGTRKNQNRLFVYNRKPDEIYTSSLGNSVHIAYDNGDGQFVPLNHQYGIVFAKATIHNNIIQEKGVINPCLFMMNQGGFGLIAVRVSAEGEIDHQSKGKVVFWTSDDLLEFKEQGLIQLHTHEYVEQVTCAYHKSDDCYEIHWCNKNGQYYKNQVPDLFDLDGGVATDSNDKFMLYKQGDDLTTCAYGNILCIDDETGKKISENWSDIYHIETHMPDQVTVSSLDQIENIRATALYSDGSTATKRVHWERIKTEKDEQMADTEYKIERTQSGTYLIKGKIEHTYSPFPKVEGYADPVILYWKEKYYFLATNDTVNDIGLFVREADSVKGLFEDECKEHLLLDVDEEKGFIQTFWAPEFHFIGHELYILFAVGGKEWGPQCHMMRLKREGSIICPDDWETPIRVIQLDGEPLGKNGITLDMTHFNVDGTSYVIWSYREHIGTPKDTGSMLYIATINEENPWILTSEPILLSRPLYGWENIQGTINNEGAYPLITDDMVYVTYSGGAACGYTYALGLLSIPRGSNYLDPALWTKSNRPVLSYFSIEGIYGPGHNSFFEDEEGNVMIAYHAEKELVPFGVRCSAIHRVHFNQHGRPIFDLTPERDVNESLRDVQLQVMIDDCSK